MIGFPATAIGDGRTNASKARDPALRATLVGNENATDEASVTIISCVLICIRASVLSADISEEIGEMQSIDSRSLLAFARKEGSVEVKLTLFREPFSATLMFALLQTLRSSPFQKSPQR